MIRVSRLFGCVAGLAVLGFGPAFADDDSAAAQAAYDAQCASCHASDDILSWAEAHPDAEERRAYFDSVLDDHFTPSDDDRALIIEHMETVIADQTEDD